MTLDEKLAIIGGTNDLVGSSSAKIELQGNFTLK
jgi:hypothetical protein